MPKIEIFIQDESLLAQATADGKLWHLAAAANTRLAELYPYVQTVPAPGGAGLAHNLDGGPKPGKLELPEARMLQPRGGND